MLLKSSLFCLALLFLMKSVGSNGKGSSKKIAANEDDEIKHSMCQDISVSFCKNIQYNRTILPNMFKHKTQKEAEKELNLHLELVNTGCSRFVRIFLCSVYIPVCTMLEHPLPPCRSFCLLAVQGCDQVMKRFGYSWPESLKCERFDESELCFRMHREMGPDYNDRTTFVPSRDAVVELDAPDVFRTSKDLNYKVFLGSSVVLRDCGIPCDDAYMFLGSELQTNVRFVVGLVSCFCFFSSSFTLSTFVVDKKRFGYPQRPFAWIALCHMCVCVVHVVGFAFKGSVACTEPFPEEETSTRRPVAIQGSHKELCAVLFAVFYYFQTSGHLWWVVLNFAWLMSACLKWSDEAISRIAKYFHALVWLLPGIQTAVVMLLGRLDGDPVSGLCGFLEPAQAKLFVFVPFVFYSVLGVFCWSAGLIGLNRVRASVKSEGFSSNNLDKLMLRIGAFGLLYMVPTISYVVCIFYEQTMRYDWHARWYFAWCPQCQYYSTEMTKAFGRTPTPPSAAFHLLKNLSALLMGFSSGFWVWNQKTRRSWESVLTSIKC